MSTHALLERWIDREGRIETDVRAALFHEVCAGPLNPALFLKDNWGSGERSADLDINAVDREGQSALHRMLDYAEDKNGYLIGRDAGVPRRLLALLEAGADPRIANRDGHSPLTDFENMMLCKRSFGLIKPLKVVVVDVKEDGTVELEFRLEEEVHRFSFPINP